MVKNRKRRENLIPRQQQVLQPRTNREGLSNSPMSPSARAAAAAVLKFIDEKEKEKEKKCFGPSCTILGGKRRRTRRKRKKQRGGGWDPAWKAGAEAADKIMQGLSEASAIASEAAAATTDIPALSTEESSAQVAVASRLIHQPWAKTMPKGASLPFTMSKIPEPPSDFPLSMPIPASGIPAWAEAQAFAGPDSPIPIIPAGPFAGAEDAASDLREKIDEKLEKMERVSALEKKAASLGIKIPPFFESHDKETSFATEEAIRLLGKDEVALARLKKIRSSTPSAPGSGAGGKDADTEDTASAAASAVPAPDMAGADDGAKAVRDGPRTYLAGFGPSKGGRKTKKKTRKKHTRRRRRTRRRRTRRKRRRRKTHRKRRRRRTRRKRKTRKKRGGGWSQEYLRPQGGWTPAYFEVMKYAIKLVGNPNNFIECEFLFVGDNNLFYFKNRNGEDFQVSENAILSRKTWFPDINPQKQSGEHTPRTKKA